MKIIKAKSSDAEALAFIIKNANREVAQLFNINFANNPKHPSFYDVDAVLADMARNEKYFISSECGVCMGCVAFEQPRPDTAYLNRLAVLPEHQKKGIGNALVDHIIQYSRHKEIQYISIGIIAEHTDLKNWYINRGFVEMRTQEFEHLPFNVTYMQYET